METGQIPVEQGDRRLRNDAPKSSFSRGNSRDLAKDGLRKAAPASLSRENSGDIPKDGSGSISSSLSRGSSGELAKGDALRRAAVDANRLKEAERCLDAYQQSAQYWVSAARRSCAFHPG